MRCGYLSSARRTIVRGGDDRWGSEKIRGFGPVGSLENPRGLGHPPIETASETRVKGGPLALKIGHPRSPASVALIHCAGVLSSPLLPNAWALGRTVGKHNFRGFADQLFS
jgi:hypothetical protein